MASDHFVLFNIVVDVDYRWKIILCFIVDREIKGIIPPPVVATTYFWASRRTIFIATIPSSAVSPSKNDLGIER
jgi:hypothetical protein